MSNVQQQQQSVYINLWQDSSLKNNESNKQYYNAFKESDKKFQHSLIWRKKNRMCFCATGVDVYS